MTNPSLVLAMLTAALAVRLPQASSFIYAQEDSVEICPEEDIHQNCFPPEDVCGLSIVKETDDIPNECRDKYLRLSNTQGDDSIPSFSYCDLD